MNEIINYIYQRKAVRRYKNMPVAKDLKDRLLPEEWHPRP
jgi:hypothetical protein